MAPRTAARLIIRGIGGLLIIAGMRSFGGRRRVTPPCPSPIVSVITPSGVIADMPLTVSMAEHGDAPRAATLCTSDVVTKPIIAVTARPFRSSPHATAANLPIVVSRQWRSCQSATQVSQALGCVALDQH